MKIFRYKILIFFIFLLKTRGGSNEYPQSMFLSRNKKKCIPLLTPVLLKKRWGLRVSKLYRHVFVMRSVIMGLPGHLLCYLIYPLKIYRPSMLNVDSMKLILCIR